MRALVLKSPRNCMHQEVMRMREMLIEVHLMKLVTPEGTKGARMKRQQAMVRQVTMGSYCMY